MGDDRAQRVPQLIAFDLDYTLWDFWIDTHITVPLKQTSSGVLDKFGKAVEFYPDVPDILNQIRTSFEDTKIAVCSRTHAPSLAREALSLITVPSFPIKKGGGGSAAVALAYFDELEIYPGSKIAHFKALHHRTGIPYTEMVFFDDERRNREVESLGVTFILVPDGMSKGMFEHGLKEWRKRCKDPAS